jgi:C-terminal processing protease CtpA/Prc
MSQSSKYFVAFLGGLAFVAAGLGGYSARALVDVGRWPLVAQREKPRLTLTGERMPVATEHTGRPDAEADYFYAVADLIQQQYVEPVAISDKMSEGAVKGMVASLSDPDSRFFDAETYPAFLARQKGVIHGAGIELSLEYDPDALKKVQDKKQVDPLMLLPVLRVSAVYPGSEAAKAGLLPGDEIRKVNGKNILTNIDIRALRKLQEDVTAKKAEPATLTALQKELQMKAKETMSAVRARDVLYRDGTHPYALEWLQNGAPKSASFNSGQIKVEPVTKTADGISLRFVSGAAEALKGQSLPDGAVIDLRNSGFGSYAEMKQSLFLVCPKGKLGTIATGRGDSPITNTGEPFFKSRRWTLLVDSSTRGAAAIFARTLVAQHVATLTGTPSDDDKWVETIEVDGKTGYTLVTGRFTSAGGSK